MTVLSCPPLEGEGRLFGDANGSRERAPDDRLRIVRSKRGGVIYPRAEVQMISMSMRGAARGSCRTT